MLDGHTKEAAMQTPVPLVLALLFASAAAAETVRVPATKDNSIVMLESEIRQNAGGAGQIRIKGNQHLVAMMFDAAALRGRVVKSATLVCRKADAAIDGLTISTIQCDWDEMKSSGLTSGMQPESRWGYPGARFPAVTGSNAFSLFCQAPSEVKDGAYRWRVDPDLVHALAVGAACGLTLHEWSADYSRNPTIFSREQSGKAPYLEVTLADAADPDPAPPTDLALSGSDPESLRLSLRAPNSGFAYEVAVNGRPLPRWNIPFVRPGEVQAIPIRDLALAPGDPITVSVVTVSRTGKRVAAATAGGKVPNPKMPALPAVAEPVAAGPPPDGLAVIPLEDKYDAAGRPVGGLPPDYRQRNGVFDGRQVTLRAARGEAVGFQALVTGAGKVTARFEMPGLRVEAYQAVYVACPGGRRVPDPLVPLGELEIKADEATPVCVYVFVPFDFKGREAAGTFELSDGRRLPVRLEVRPFAIPREASFACEMNGYGLPDRVSQFYRLQEIAYDHRAHINLLAYGHSSTAPGARKANMDMLMDGPAGDGSRRMDERRYNDVAPGAKHGCWDDFVRAFGPHLSGSCFEHGRRGAIQPPGFYLTFHESWPLKVREYSSGSPDAYEAFKARAVYAATFVNILKDFIEVARREGWIRAGFQVYLNNKGTLNDPAKAPWILDEPASYWDYRALAYYADLVRLARGPACPVRVQFRIDISRPEFDRGQLWGKADLWVVSSAAFHDYRRLVADRAERDNMRIWVYGTTNKVEDTSRTLEAWALDAWRGGACGILPWQTINKDGSAMTKADQLGLFIFTKGPGGQTVIRHSMRLAGYLRAEQDVEYLELVRKKLNLTPGQVRAFADHYLKGGNRAPGTGNRDDALGGRVVKSSEEDAGTPEYDKITPEGLRQLREAAALLLAK
jgi:hypothetical protein